MNEHNDTVVLLSNEELETVVGGNDLELAWQHSQSSTADYRSDAGSYSKDSWEEYAQSMNQGS